MEPILNDHDLVPPPPSCFHHGTCTSSSHIPMPCSSLSRAGALQKFVFVGGKGGALLMCPVDESKMSVPVDTDSLVLCVVQYSAVRLIMRAHDSSAAKATARCATAHRNASLNRQASRTSQKDSVSIERRESARSRMRSTAEENIMILN